MLVLVVHVLHHLLENRSANVGQPDDVLLGLPHAGREHGGHGGAGRDGDAALAVHLGARGGDELDVLGRIVGFVHGYGRCSTRNSL